MADLIQVLVVNASEIQCLLTRFPINAYACTEISSEEVCFLVLRLGNRVPFAVLVLELFIVLIPFLTAGHAFLPPYEHRPSCSASTFSIVPTNEALHCILYLYCLINR